MSYMTYIVKLQDDKYNKMAFEFRKGTDALEFMEECAMRTLQNLTATLEIRSEVCEEPEE